MKIIPIKNLAKCPLCGAKAQMRKNASKDFQVACTKCDCCTGWDTKPNAIVRWYNMIITLNAQKQEALDTQIPQQKE